MKKGKKVMKMLPKFIVAITVILAMLLSYVAPLTRVIAESYGEGEHSINVGLNNTLGFTINSVTVNSYTWESQEDEFHSANDQYHIVIEVSGTEATGDKVPRVQYGGNWNEYIESSTQVDGNNYSFVLDVTNSEHQGFLGLEILEQEQQPVNPGGSEPGNQPGPGEHVDEPHFDGKAYVVWSCGNGTCYHYFDNIPDFDDGNSTFYKDTDVKADNDERISFDVYAEYKGWALKEDFENWVEVYKNKKNITGEIDWTKVDPEDIMSYNPPDMREWEEKALSSDTCTKTNTPEDVFRDCVDNYRLQSSDDALPFIRLQPLGEPDYKNAYVSYGDRNFKVVIYNDKYRGIAMGDLSQLSYYPASWTNPFIKRDQFDISDTTKDKPGTIDSILLESTVMIKPLEWNSFEIVSIEALDVPEDAVEISEVNGEWKLVFSSNFYDNVVFRATDSEGEETYFQVKRYTIDGWIRMVDEHPVLTADFYFDRERSYEDFELKAKIVYKDGTTRNVELTAAYGVDNGLGDLTRAYEVDEQTPVEGEAGKGLKRSTFECKLEDGEDRKIAKIYLNAEYKGSTASTYAGAYVGSGEGILANLYSEEEE